MPRLRGGRPLRRYVQVLRVLLRWQWKDKVECGEDSIQCLSDGRAYDSWEIMDDCGDTVKGEANWCLERAKALQDGSVSPS